MSLRLIYGRTGTGKSTEIFKEIKENSNLANKNYVITPEQFSFSAEKNLLNILGKKSTINTEVITFNRMAERLSVEIEGKKENTLTKSGKSMLIYSILDSQKNNLQFLKNSENDIDLSINTIKEFKKHGITVDSLNEAISSVENELLKTKLKDINTVYLKYEEAILNKYIDEEDKLTKLANRLKKSDLFKDAEIYIDEFSGFTKQEYDIIKELLKKAKRITVAFTIDNLEKRSPETDIFSENKKTWEHLTEIAKELKISIEKPIICSNNYKLKNEELIHLEQNLYKVPYITYNKTLKDIKLLLTQNPYQEIEELAKEITKLVRDEEYRYKDIAIITSNTKNCSSLMKSVLTKTNNIPVFIDQKEDLSKSQIIKYILSILEIFSTNWNTEAVISYIKSGLLDINIDEIYRLENYVVKWGIKQSKWYKEDWNYEENNPNELRKKIVEPLLVLKENLGKEKTAKNIGLVIYKFLEENKITEKAREKIEKYEAEGEILLAKNYKQSYDILIDLIDEIVEIFKEDRMTFKEFMQLLKVGLGYKELGNIPESLDQVIVGDINRTISTNIKVAFIIGLNDGIFPEINKVEGFLNDFERETLKSIGKEIAKTTVNLVFDEQFKIYKAFTTPREKLYLLYTSTDKEGKALRPSILISKIKRIFLQLKEESIIIKEIVKISTKENTFKDMLKAFQNLRNGEKIDDIWYEVLEYFRENPEYTERIKNARKGLNHINTSEKISQKNIEKLYGKTLKTSISQLENYQRCPFSYILKYGLKLKEKEEYKIRTLDTGSFMHDVIDTFFKKIQNVHSIDNSLIPEIVQEIIDEKLNLKQNYLFTSSSKFILLTNRLKKLITKSIEYIVYQIQNSDFNILSNELEFTKKIDNIELTGKIDRLDISNDGNYIRVIDYKSSTKNINLNDVFAGLQIQLLTYMDVIAEKQNKKPAGVFYFNLIEPIINSSKGLNEEEIEDKIRNEFKMKGLILADVNVAKMMDKTIDKGNSKIIPVYIDKDGNISKSRSSTLTEEEFTKLQKKIRKIIKEITKEILSGNINIKPIYDKKTKIDACRYCEFKSICGFDNNTNCYKYIENKTKEELLNSI